MSSLRIFRSARCIICITKRYPNDVQNCSYERIVYYLRRCKQASLGKNSNAERDNDCSYDINNMHDSLFLLRSVPVRTNASGQIFGNNHDVGRQTYVHISHLKVFIMKSYVIAHFPDIRADYIIFSSHPPGNMYWML